LILNWLKSFNQKKIKVKNQAVYESELPFTFYSLLLLSYFFLL